MTTKVEFNGYHLKGGGLTLRLKVACSAEAG